MPASKKVKKTDYPIKILSIFHEPYEGLYCSCVICPVRKFVVRLCNLSVIFTDNLSICTGTVIDNLLHWRYLLLVWDLFVCAVVMLARDPSPPRRNKHSGYVIAVSACSEVLTRSQFTHKAIATASNHDVYMILSGLLDVNINEFFRSFPQATYGTRVNVYKFFTESL